MKHNKSQKLASVKEKKQWEKVHPDTAPAYSAPRNDSPEEIAACMARVESGALCYCNDWCDCKECKGDKQSCYGHCSMPCKKCPKWANCFNEPNAEATATDK